MKSAQKIKELFVGNEIIFYKEEIDKINGIYCSMWEKEFILCLWGYFKFLGKNTLSCQSIPINDILKLTSIKKIREQNKKNIYMRMQESNVVKIDDSFNITFLKVFIYSKEMIKIKSPVDIYVCFKFLKNEHKCTMCGKIFKYNMNNKRNICIECWKKMESEKTKKRVYKARNSKNSRKYRRF